MRPIYIYTRTLSLSGNADDLKAAERFLNRSTKVMFWQHIDCPPLENCIGIDVASIDDAVDVAVHLRRKGIGARFVTTVETGVRHRDSF